MSVCSSVHDDDGISPYRVGGNEKPAVVVAAVITAVVAPSVVPVAEVVVVAAAVAIILLPAVLRAARVGEGGATERASERARAQA